ncbi:hypothetical protein BASA61_001043 [Batrachochytrium salamandrivorans]|nr:hypothetical protein BASA61_001043 [Batrachochytrium salamandrivorans]KAH9244342.1 hypothetical protein BASA81_018259 [Batrachochytrium salamandrivorans]KAH9270860.1 hypothetical protein BASA83_007013 [Batrachochytrium salamandrivorans]
MRLSTGIILSILSTNVFAIEHPNDVHSGSLLARRAVVADTDSPLLQKRNNGQDDEDQEEQAKPKTYVPNIDPHQAGNVYTKDCSKDDPNPNPNSNLDTGKDPTNSVAYDPNQDRGAKGGRGNVHTGIVPNQEGSSLTDASRSSSSQVLGHIETELPRKKKELELALSKEKAAAASDKVMLHFCGRGDCGIESYVRELFLLALKVSQSYRGRYKDSVKSPFVLELLPSTSDEAEEKYKRLQKDVQQSIEGQISDVNSAIDSVAGEPEKVIHWLKELMKKTDNFYQSIFKTKSRYSDLLKELGISDGRHLKDLKVYIAIVQAYKRILFRRFNNIKKMIDDHIELQKQKGTSKSLSHPMESKKRPEVESKPSGNGALLEYAGVDNLGLSDDEEVADLTTDDDEEIGNIGLSNVVVVANLIDF